MGKKMKLTGILATVVLALVVSLLALWCGSPFARLSSSAEAGEVFTMDTAASLRYSKQELRFRVKMDGQTKEFAQGADELGMIIAPTTEFSGKTGEDDDYLQIDGKTQVTVDVGSIYEEGGYFYYNGAVAVSGLTQKYSAVAYIKGSDDNYTWATPATDDGQSVQTVASKLWFTSSRGKVASAYAGDIGTQDTPILINREGINSYDALLSLASDAVENYYFSLTENLVVDTKFTGHLVGEYKPYTLDEIYTVNHKITDVYSVDEEIDLSEKVTAIPQFGGGNVSYTVKSAPAGAETVAVEGGKLTPTMAGKYVISAKVDGVDPRDFTIEVGNSEYVNGLMLDVSSAADIMEGTLSYTSDNHDSTVSVTFDATEKFDVASAGSLKLVSSYKANSGLTYTLPFKPAFSKAYYQALYNDGEYTHISMRMKLQTTMTDTVNDRYNFYPIYESAGGISITMLNEYGTTLREASSRADIADYHFKNDGSGYNVLGQWIEVLVPLNIFLLRYWDAPTNMFRFQNIGAPNNFSTTIWIDNIYAVKALENQGTYDDTAKTYELGQQLDIYNELGYTPSDDDIELIDDCKIYNTPISLEDGKCTLDKKGEYSLFIRARNRYGIIGGMKTTYKALIFGPDTEGFAYRIDYSTSYGSTQDGTITSEYVTDEYYDDTDAGALKITVSSTATTKRMENYLFITPYFDYSYYEGLKNAGYQYIEFEYKMTRESGWTDGKFHTLTTDSIGYHRTKKSNGEETDVDAPNPAGINIGDGSWGITSWGWCKLRYSLDLFLEKMQSDGRIRIYIFAPGSNQHGTIHLYLGGIYATK